MDVFIDPRFDDIYTRNPLVLVDVGARGGLKSNWDPARRHLRVIGFEADKKEYAQLIERTAGDSLTRFFDVALHNRREPIQLNVARDRGLSSIFEPDREFLEAFPDSTRFDTMDVHHVDADTLDNLVQAHQVKDVDFVKADTQGSELFVLEGASCALASSVAGVEVEVEFSPIYKDQPVFADVDAFMRGLGFQLFDLRPCYWKRAVGRDIGGPRGQMIWADALYLKTIPALRGAVAACDPALRKSKILKAISISLLYGYYDFALAIAREAGEWLSPNEQSVIEQRLRAGGVASGPVPQFPGRRALAAALHRLWRIFLPRDDAWSVGNAKLGN
jgi:FkbM family methyltransferase